MNTATKILLGATATAAVTAYAYRRGIDALQFSVDGYQADNSGHILMRLRVVNPNKFFGYPVPRMLVNVFDGSGSFVGTVQNEQLQYIPANTASFVYGIVKPNYGNFLSIVANLLQDAALLNSGQAFAGLNFHGIVQVGKFEIPFETTTLSNATT